MAGGAPFTDAERQAIVAAYEAGRPVRRIADDIGRSFSGVRSVLAAAGVALRPRGTGVATRDRAPLIAAYQAGQSLSAIARSSGLSDTTVRYHLIDAGVALRPAGWPKDAWKKRAA